MIDLNTVKPNVQQVFLWNPANQAVLDGDTQRYRPRRRRQYWWLFFVGMLIFVLLASEGKDLYLRVVGREITATVQSKRIYTYSDKNGEHTEYLVTYQFAPPGQAQAYNNESNVSDDVYYQLDAQSLIKVVYDPNAPNIADTFANVMSFPFVALITVIICAGGAVYFGYRWYWQMRLRNEGTVIRSKLGAFEATQGKGKRRGYYDIEMRFSFYALDGHTVEAKIKDSLTTKEYDTHTAAAVGMPIAILYLNDKRYALL